MRVFTNKNTIVVIKYFTASATHYKMLLQLQAELPNLRLEVDGDGPKPKLIPINQLNLDDPKEIRDLNPNET